MSMHIRIETVTPDKATAWINQNKSNRKLRDGVVEKYADDMKRGRWTNCPEPISFYADGDLADGQHRLWAIVESQTEQIFPVARGLSREDGLNINTGMARTLVDAGRISGRDPNLSNTLISTARAIAEGSPAGSAKSNAARLVMVEDHREAASWAVSNGPKAKYLRNALVLAAIGRAWYHEADTDRLKRFCDVLNTGLCEGEAEHAAVVLRNYLLQRASASSSAALWRDSFLKVQNAISYFMRGKKLTVIKSTAEEVYPLPKKKPARKVAA